MKRKIDLLLSMALLLSGCSENTAPSNTSLTTATPPTPPTTTTTATTEEEPLKVEKKLEILTSFADAYDDIIELYEEKYGIPEKGETSYGEEFADSAVVITPVHYADYYDELAKRISSDDSPDIAADYKYQYYWMLSEGLYQPIDDIVDTYSEEWSGTRKYMDELMIGGKNYFAVIDGRNYYLFWYRNSVIEAAGLEDPYELYKKDEWNWDKYTEMAEKFMKSGEGKYGSDGWNLEYALLASTGKPLVQLSDGKFKSNLFDPTVEKGMEFWDYVVDNNYRRICMNRETCQPYEPDWCDGKTLFFCGDESFYSDTAQKHMRKHEWPENDIGVVPVPFSPDTDENYYYYNPGVLFAYVKGSDNSEGVGAWIECANELSNSEEYKEKTRSALKEDSYWTDELLNRIDEFEANGTGVIELAGGISFSSGMISSSESVINALFYPKNLYGDTTYKELRELYADEINGTVDYINSFIK